MLEPEIQQLITAFAALNLNYINMPPATARELAHGLANQRPHLNDIPAMQIMDKTIELPERKLALRIYKPLSLAEQTLPVIVYFHGGGFVWGKPEFCDDPCCIIADRTRSVLISVDYRYAPEFPFPAALNDCYDTVCYVQQHAEEFNIIPDKLSVAGDSAGGNLAAALCLRARDEQGPAIKAQLLIYPCLEYDFTKESFRTMGKNYLLTQELVEWFYNQYLPRNEDRKNPLAMPLNAKNFSHLPQALIITAKYDPLCDEGKEYANRLSAAGNKVELICYKTMCHSFIVYGTICHAARLAVEEIAEKFAEILGEG